MQTGSVIPLAQDLVLVGGGHSHAIALKKWGMNPLPGVRVTLVSDVSYAPYSGMLPGHVAGFYSYEETHIDLRRLARFAGADFVRTKAIGLNPQTRELYCEGRPAITYDFLSLDIGSTPQRLTVPGAGKWAIPAKPVPLFLEAWSEILAEVRANPHTLRSLVIVGGGAGGVELALNVQTRLDKLYAELQIEAQPWKIQIVHSGERLLPGHNARTSLRLTHVCQQRGIKLLLSERVSEVRADSVVCQSGAEIPADAVFWVTQASPALWVSESGLQTDERGFVLVDDTLRSVSHPRVFAAGDIATMQNHRRPKAGVFAVRQGPPLFENWVRSLQNRDLQPFQPQQRYLSLIGTGTERAIASWGPVAWEAGWLWRWKDQIDRKFMTQFAELPVMADSESGNVSEEASGQMRCQGCGSKVGRNVLETVLRQLKPMHFGSNIQLGLDAPDDAAILNINGQQWAQTVDFFSSPFNDPYLFGQIATQHCLSDLYALGATPQSVLIIAIAPYAVPRQQERILSQVLAGVTEVLQAANITPIGGHTAEGPELALGLTCQGPVENPWRKKSLQPGQSLILTKPLGTGVLLAADRQYRARADWFEAGIASMNLSNGPAAEILRAYGSTAGTDVTGFGLLGHLREMLSKDVYVSLELGALPKLPGVLELIESGILSSLQAQNLRAADNLVQIAPDLAARGDYQLLFDPQTSGGLSAGVPSSHVDDCLQALWQAGYLYAAEIGKTHLQEKDQPKIEII
ncbi:MAG: selenide, water dikinase SelD [Cyanobacteria bacterium P01_H01_bin.15]